MPSPPPRSSTSSRSTRSSWRCRTRSSGGTSSSSRRPTSGSWISTTSRPSDTSPSTPGGSSPGRTSPAPPSSERNARGWWAAASRHWSRVGTPTAGIGSSRSWPGRTNEPPSGWRCREEMDRPSTPTWPASAGPRAPRSRWCASSSPTSASLRSSNGRSRRASDGSAGARPSPGSDTTCSTCRAIGGPAPRCSTPSSASTRHFFVPPRAGSGSSTRRTGRRWNRTWGSSSPAEAGSTASTG